MRDASVPRRWPEASTTNQLRSISLARGLYVLFIVLVLVPLRLANRHSPEHQSVRRSCFTIEGRRAGVRQGCRHIGRSRPSVPHSQECGDHSANHLAQKGVPDHLNGDPLTFPLLLAIDANAVDGSHRLPIDASERGEVVRTDEHLRCPAHLFDVQRITDAESASLAQGALWAVPDEVAVFTPLRSVSRLEAAIDLLQARESDVSRQQSR